MKTVLTRMDVLKTLIFTMSIMFAKTNFTSKCVHFVWSQLQHRIKYWNYILEFQSLQNSTFENTRKVTLSIKLLVEIFKAQTLATACLCTRIFVPLNFGRRMNAFSEKTEHYEVLSLSKTFFQVEFMCKCCYCGLFICSFQFRINIFI